jgi:UDP-glucose 4-epimerase
MVWPEGVTGREMPDLSGSVDWTPVLDGATHAVHLAGLAHSHADIPDKRYMAINADAAGALARAASAAKLERLVLMSSVRAQCGPTSDAVLHGSETPHPEDAYGRSKLAAEANVAGALSGTSTEWTALRPVLVFGPGVKGNMRSLMRLARLPVPMPIGAVAGRRSILGIENLCHAVAHALVEPRCAGRVFLVADREALSVPEIVAALRYGAGRKPGLFAVPASIMTLCARATGFAGAWKRLNGSLVADTMELRATGWSPSVDTRAALAAAMRAEAGAP